jgi:pilus assembly protein CpaB
MRPSTLVGLALLFGAVTAYLAAQWVGLGAQTSDRPHAKVVVASALIEAGTTIASTQVKSMDWLGAEVPPQVIQDPSKVQGRVTRYPLQPGELVLESKLAPIDAKAGLSAMITEGKRAISVRVNEVIAVAGFTLPGNYVDVLVSGKDNAQQPFSRVVIARAKVLAIAQETAADANKPKVVNAVTLELTPQEVERLDLARSVGTLSLVLRNESDQQPWQSSGTRMADILGADVAKAIEPAGVAGAPRPLAETGAVSLRPRDGAGQSARPVKIEEIRGMVREGAQP